MSKTGKGLMIAAIVLLSCVLCALAGLTYLCMEPGTDVLTYVREDILPLFIKGVAVAGTVAATLAPTLSKLHKGSTALQLTTLENGRLEEHVEKNSRLYEDMKRENREDRERMQEELRTALASMEKEMKEEREAFRAEYRSLFSDMAQGVADTSKTTKRTEEIVRLMGINSKEMVAKGVSGQIMAIGDGEHKVCQNGENGGDGHG